MGTRLPDFLVIGAAKSGTTSLRSYLEQHPEIFMADYGEPSFFAHEGEQVAFVGPGDDEWAFVTSLDDYENLFRAAPEGSVRGEVSPRYLYFPRSSERMRRYVPEARIVAMLRHPVDRAYSHFLMNRSRGCEPEADFDTALAREAERTARGWGWDWRYVSLGLYHEQMARYMAAFPREQIKVYVYEEWKAGDDGLFADLFQFLGVDDTFRPDTSVRARVATMPRSHHLARLLQHGGTATNLVRRALPADAARRLKSRISARNTVPPPRLQESERRRLFTQFFADDCSRLEELISRDLSSWR